MICNDDVMTRKAIPLRDGTLLRVSDRCQYYGAHAFLNGSIVGGGWRVGIVDSIAAGNTARAFIRPVRGGHCVLVDRYWLREAPQEKK